MQRTDVILKVEMLHEISHGRRVSASDLRIRLRLKIGESKVRAVIHGRTAVGAKGLDALRRLVAVASASHLPDSDA